MRRTDRPPSAARSYLLAGAALLGGIAALFLVVAVSLGVLVAVALAGFDGLQIDADPKPIGVTVSTAGTVELVPGSCGPPVVQSVRLLAADGRELWRADNLGAAAGGAPRAISVGTPPEGFTEVVPLAGPLDPAGTYRAQIAVVVSGSAAPTVAGSGSDALYTLFGGEATFRPADLAPGTVWLDAAPVPLADVDAASCRAEDIRSADSAPARGRGAPVDAPPSRGGPFP